MLGIALAALFHLPPSAVSLDGGLAAAAAWLPPGDIGLAADALTLHLEDGAFELDRPRIDAPGVTLEADRVEVSGPPRRVRMLDVRLRLDLPAGASFDAAAEEATLAGGEIRFGGARFSRCPLESAGWTVVVAGGCASADGDVTARSAVLRFGDLPVLKLPWVWLRFGRLPGALPPSIGSREGRGPFLRLAAFLPAGGLGDFEIASTAFPLDGVDVAAAWSRAGDSFELAGIGVEGEARLAARADVAAAFEPGGAFVARGTVMQAGAVPAGIVGSMDGDERGARRPSIRADAFTLSGGDGWSVAAGAATWQDSRAGAAREPFLAAPRMRMDLAPGLLGDAIVFPGSFHAALWRGAGDRPGAGTGWALVSGWRQSVEAALPIPGVAVRPFATTAGWLEDGLPAGDDRSEAAWAAAGVDAWVSIERRWPAGGYHRSSLRLRYARVLALTGGAATVGAVGPGPDLFRVALPQTLRAGGLTLVATAWAESRSLDGWDPAAVLLGLEAAVDGDAMSADLRVAFDGAGEPGAVLAAVRLPPAAPFDFALRYAYLPGGTGAAASFLRWEDRLGLGRPGVPRALHGLAADATIRLLGDRLSFGAGADFDLAAGTLASMRFSAAWTDPSACLAVEAAVGVWLDERIPTVAVAVRL